MTPRMFQDLVVSSAVRPARGRGRALPLSLAVHGPRCSRRSRPSRCCATPGSSRPRPLRQTDRCCARRRGRGRGAAAAAPPVARRAAAPRHRAARAPARLPARGDAGPAARCRPTSRRSAPAIRGRHAPLCLHDCTPGDGTPGGTAPVGDGTGGAAGDDRRRRARAGVDVTPPAEASAAPRRSIPELGRPCARGARS